MSDEFFENSFSESKNAISTLQFPRVVYLPPLFLRSSSALPPLLVRCKSVPMIGRKWDLHRSYKGITWDEELNEEATHNNFLLVRQKERE